MEEYRLTYYDGRIFCVNHLSEIDCAGIDSIEHFIDDYYIGEVIVVNLVKALKELSN